jgi:pimeloyl-ACP methyl ester carboxylesterase
MKQIIAALSAWSLAILSTAALTSSPIESGTITTPDNHTLYFEKRGSGPETIIAPGRLFVAEGIAPLSDEWTIITYDMRNRGRSSAIADKTQISIGNDVQDLETVRNHFGIEKAHLIGFSYLGMLVVLYANEHPDRVNRIVQLGPTPLVLNTKYDAKFDFKDPSEAKLAELSAATKNLREDGLPQKDPKSYCLEDAKLVSVMLVGDESRAAKLNATTAATCELENEWPTNLGLHFNALLPTHVGLEVTLDDLAKTVAHPVLTIHGTFDRNAPYAAGREWAHRLPDARLLTIEGAAHMALLEEKEKVVAAIRTFLRGEWPQGAEDVTESPVATQ